MTCSGARASRAGLRGLARRRYLSPSPIPRPLMLRRRAFALAFLGFTTPPLARPPRLLAQGPELSVHNIFGTREFASDLVDVQWRRDGSRYTLLDSDST